MVSHVLYNLAKGPRVLNRKRKEGSILALYRPGQGQILHFFNPNIRVSVFLGYEIGESANGKRETYPLQKGVLEDIISLGRV